MFLEEGGEDLFETGLPDLLEIIVDPGVRFFDLHQAVQVDRGGNHHRITFYLVNGRFQVFHLLIAISHSRQKLSDVRIDPEGLGQFTYHVRTRIDQFGGSEFLGGHNAGTDLHFAMGEGGPVFDHQNLLAADYRFVVDPDGGCTIDHRGFRVDSLDVIANSLDVLRIGRIDLVQDNHIGNTDVDFAGIVAQLSARPVGIRDRYHEVGFVEREIVVPAVPQNDVTAFGIFFGSTQNGFVVDAGVDHVSANHVRFILFHLFDGTFVLFKIFNSGETLHFLGNEVAVRHRMTNSHHFKSPGHQDLDDPAGGLAFAATCAGSAHGDDRLGALDHRVFRAQQDEIRTGSIDNRAQVHNTLVRDVAVSKIAYLHVVLTDQINQLRFGINGNALGIQFSGKSCRILSSVDVGNLGRGERHYVERRVVSVIRVEIVKIPTGGTNDDNILFHANLGFIGEYCDLRIVRGTLQTYSFFENWQNGEEKFMVSVISEDAEIGLHLQPKHSPMVEDKILEKARQAVKELYGAELPAGSINLEKTRKEFTGDFTLTVFPFLKVSRKSPEVTAGEIGAYLVNAVEEVIYFQVIKGFLNLVIDNSYWSSFLGKAAFCEGFGFRTGRNEPPVVLEYSSPNTNKPLHLGHIRNNLLGFSLAEILKANGHTVVKVNLVNDRGIHICKSMLAYMKWGNLETPESAGIKGDHLIGRYYVLFDRHYREEIKSLVSGGMPEEEAQRHAPLINEAQEILRRWESHDAEVYALWEKMNGWAYEGFDETYRRLGVDFDKIYHESETYLLGKNLVMEGLAKGMLEQRSDGSIWIDLRNEGLDEKLLLRSDGTSVYMTQDLGTADLRYNDFHPSSMIYVVGNEQNYHFDVLRRVLDRLGKEYAGRIHHLSYGMVELPEGKMKSREGTVVDADDLMDEMYRTAEETTRELGKSADLEEEAATALFQTIGLGALKYFILKVDPKKNMLFIPRESIDFNGNTGPFIQYTYARIRSLLSRAGEAGIDWNNSKVSTNLALFPQEKETIKKLYQFPEVVSQAGDELSPAVIANYVYDLAKSFNQFYQELPVLKEIDRDRVNLRIVIAYMTGEVIRKSMALLGIGVPERM